MPQLVECPHCQGSGRIKLSGVYARTLALLRKHGREVAGVDLARMAGCKPTAMNNRLAALEQHGLAGSRRDGKRRLFHAATV